MIAVLIPARNEQALIGRCLKSVIASARHPELDEEVIIVVATDHCADDTARIAERFGVQVVEVQPPGGVGQARAQAATHAIAQGATWLAMTDADSLVPNDWLIQQRRSQSDAFCGLVEVEDWEDYSDAVQLAFIASQQAFDGHDRVHGANMGVSAEFYARCGGFEHVACSEDVALVAALVRVEAKVARLAQPIVRTSARGQARIRGGFSDFLKALADASISPS
jgi:glycosyltransferase involved in cell wall biosynthesis